MLFTDQEYQQLIENGKGDGDSDIIIPVVRIIPEFNFTFLATRILHFVPDVEIAHGFGMKGNGKEQLSRAYIRTNGSRKQLVGMEARKDYDFVAAYPLSVHKQIAEETRQLITNVDTISTLLVEIRCVWGS